MRIRTKEDVELHSDGIDGSLYPAINVKVYHYPSVYQVKDEFNCSEEVAEQALAYAWKMGQRIFWEEVQGIANEVLAPHFGEVTVNSAGRCGGWLIVDGCDGVGEVDWGGYITDGWDAVDLAKWFKFERIVKETIKWLISWENVKEDIAANRWAEEGAQEYNFYEWADGHNECLVDMAAI